MKRRQIKIELLLPAILMLTFAGAGGILVRPVKNPDQMLPARFGDVWWDHDLHARMKEYNCQTCHHTENPGVTAPKPCSQCHDLLTSAEALILADLYFEQEPEEEPQEATGEKGPPAMEVFHAKCVGCHQAVKEGPVGCRDCHAQTFTGAHGMVSWDHRLHSRQMNQLTCEACHHKDIEAGPDSELTQEEIDKNPYLQVVETEADYRACDECHQPLEMLSLDMSSGLEEHEEEVHFQCAFCHVVEDPEVGVSQCTECHEQMDPNPAGTPLLAKTPPSIEQAIHAKCLECHNIFDPDLRAEMPGVCTDCHDSGISVFEGDSAGPAIWSHNRHRYTELEDFFEYTCDKCHHTDIVNEPHMACDRCHGKNDFFGIIKLEDAVHQRCVECHEDEMNGPVECTGCHSENRDALVLLRGESKEGVVWWGHAFHADNMGFSCRECHHNMIKKDGFPYTACETAIDCPDNAADPQPCQECHVRIGDFDEAWLEPVEGDNAAGITGSGLEALSLGEAMHGACIKCHQRMEAGPVECEQCHTKTNGND